MFVLVGVVVSGVQRCTVQCTVYSIMYSTLYTLYTGQYGIPEGRAAQGGGGVKDTRGRGEEGEGAAGGPQLPARNLSHD